MIFFICINGKLDRNSNSLDFEHHILPRPRKTIEPEELEVPKEVNVESAKLISLMVSFAWWTIFIEYFSNKEVLTFTEKNYLVEHKETKKWIFAFRKKASFFHRGAWQWQAIKMEFTVTFKTLVNQVKYVVNMS